MKCALRTVAVIAVIGMSVGVALPASAEEPGSSESEATLVAESESLVQRISESGDAGRTSHEQLAEATGLPVAGPGSLQVEADGRVGATVVFMATPSAAQLDQVAQLARVDRVLTILPAVVVTADADKFDDLAAIEGVRSVDPDIAPVAGTSTHAQAPLAAFSDPASCRAFPFDGDGPLRSGVARETFGVDGTGITVGIISDSYGSATQITTPADDVEAGLLPGLGNPCGYVTPVEVLKDVPTGDDEGRAMAQLVHGVAPGARLVFATGYDGGIYGMAQAIHDLAAAGADVIVDDLTYYAETYFQQSVVSAAITSVRNAGVAYYTSAGNSNAVGVPGSRSEGLPISGWQTPAYRPMACPAWVSIDAVLPSPASCLDFDPSGAEVPYDTVGLGAAPSELSVIASWGNAINGLTAVFELQLYDVSGPTPQRVAKSAMLSVTTPNTILRIPGSAPAGEYRLVVVRLAQDAGTVDPALWIGTVGDSDKLEWRTFDRSAGGDVVGPVSLGHAADGSAVGVAAVDQATPTVSETFSAPGPGTLLFEPYDPLSPGPAQALPASVTVPAPQIAGIDGVRTSFFPEVTGGDGFHRFYGTSAAAPTVAGVHALALSYAPDTPQVDMTRAIEQTASGLTNPFAGVLPDEDVFGAGLADADALLASLPVHPLTGLSATALSDTSIAANWTEVTGAAGYRAEVFSAAGPVYTADLAAGVTAMTFTGLQPETTYDVRVAALNDGSQAGTPASASVTTPRTPQPASPPTAPTQSSLAPSPAAGLSVSKATVDAGDSVVVSGLPARSWVYGWLFSDPAALGWAWTGVTGSATLTIPANASAGSHRLAFRAANGADLGWVGLQVTSNASTSRALPRTGTAGHMSPIVWASPFLLAAGAGLLMVGQCRRRAKS